MGTAHWTLFATRGTGSAVVEAAIALASITRDAHGTATLEHGPSGDLQPAIDLEIVEVEYLEEGPRSARLFELNPLGQLPTLVLPDGTVMTESAAIVLWLTETFPATGLAPPIGDPQRALFLRYLLFVVAAIYPTFTYGDFPSRWVPIEAGEALVASTNRHRERLWLWLESQAAPRPEDWFLGERFSALDLYIGVMTRWRPRRRWFSEHCPRLSAMALRVDEVPELAPVWRRNFGRG